MPDYSTTIETVADALATQGYCILDHVLANTVNEALLGHCKSLDQAQFKPAGIGRATHHQHNQQIRTDQIVWQDSDNPLLAAYFDWIEQLRLGLNRVLYLGLFDYECHYAYYPAGAFYRKHIDAFKAQRNRMVSTILYLNPAWSAEAGGKLILYHPDDSGVLTRIEPLFGRMVIFLSEQFPHEVATTRQERYSLTGWYRVNRG
ncbi:2OG-Fe(II) oxygenase [Thiofilum flexile]|uniref:2OG-Fe(II) oxygenase n=1 Tax=Thiofilum flexile TaxID=125627 RepID=UPI00035E3664|nr:2OG-Fe(II) oxygenase [Thiofilum flexile]